MKFLTNVLKAIRLAVGLAKQTPKILLPYRFPRSAEKLLNGFSQEPITYSAYEDLMRYMVISWITYRNKTSSGGKFLSLSDEFKRGLIVDRCCTYLRRTSE